MAAIPPVAFKVLAILDTIHDFYKERGVASDDEEDIDVTKMLFIRLFIARVIRNHIENDAELRAPPFAAALPPTALIAPINDVNILQELNNLVYHLTTGKIRSISSNFEPNVVKCFEEWYPFELSAKTTREDTYDAIVGMGLAADGAKDAAKNAKIAEYNGLRGISDILILTSADNSSFGALTDTDKNRLADFILNYFFGDAGQAPRFTFDGKAGIVAKVFKGIPQSRNLIFPQTIADSAPTSFNSFHGRNEFRFPVGGPEAGVDPVAPLGAGEIAYPQKYAKSNIYTRGNCSISYVNTGGFDAKHPFGFSLRITYGDQKVDIKFSATQTEGPSVNYLISLLQVAENAVGELHKVKSTKTTTLRIGDTLHGKAVGTAITGLYSDIVPTPGAAVGVGVLRLILKAILLDIKRTGDNEQAEAIITEALGIFCSIDHLSVLYARLKKKNCIFHVNEKMMLFRFLTVAVDPAIQAANAAIWKARQASDLLTKIDQYIGADAVRAPLSVAFRDQALHIQIAARDGTGPFFNIVTMLLRLKMIDILQKLRTSGAIQNTHVIQEGNHLAAPANDITDDQRGIIAAIAAVNPSNAAQQVINNNIRLVDQASGIITNVFDNFFRTLNSFNITTTNITNINKDIIQIPGTNFISKKNHELFNYNAEPFYKLDKNIESIVAIGARVRGQRYREKTGIISILQRMGYFTNVENIVNQFYDDRIRELIKQILDVNTRCDNIIIAGNKMLEEKHKLDSILELFNQNNMPLAGGEPDTRGDGLYHFQMHANVQPIPWPIPGVPAPLNILGEITNLYSRENAREFPPPAAAAPVAYAAFQGGVQGGGAIQLYKQKGGAYPAQFSDFNDLVRTICAMATVYIESVYLEVAKQRLNTAEMEMTAAQRNRDTAYDAWHAAHNHVVAAYNQQQAAPSPQALFNANTILANAQRNERIVNFELGRQETILVQKNQALQNAQYVISMEGLHNPPAGITPQYVIQYILHSPEYINSTRNMIESIISEYEIRLKEIRSTPEYELTIGESMLSYILSFANRVFNNQAGAQIILPTPNITTLFDNIDTQETPFLDEVTRRDRSYLRKITDRLVNRNPLPTDGDNRPVLEGLQLMILHFLHFGFRKPHVEHPPAVMDEEDDALPDGIEEAVSLFRAYVTQIPDYEAVRNSIREENYDTLEKCDILHLGYDLRLIINKLRFDQRREIIGGNILVGGARKPRRNRTRKFHVKRRRTIKRRRS